MKLQPDQNTVTNDVVMTPLPLAKRIIEHFNLYGRILDPARGQGAFYDQIQGEKDWCEISQGRDFFTYRAKADCIITNPPWSLFRNFLIHSMELADNIFFLITINHLWTKARIRDIKEGGFGVREIFLVDTPSNFPQSGFQVGVIHLQRGWDGDVKITEDNNMVQGTLDFFCNEKLAVDN